jgi:hypothetical protein
MMLTFGNWMVIALIFAVGGIFTLLAFFSDDTKAGVITLISTLVICVIILFTLAWYNTNTERGRRALKDNQSNFNGGIYREITITAEDGREIFHYEGKVDIETSHEGSENYILFESEDGRRYIIYYGITDTVLIIEKDAAAD